MTWNEKISYLLFQPHSKQHVLYLSNSSINLFQNSWTWCVWQPEIWPELNLNLMMNMGKESKDHGKLFQLTCMSIGQVGQIKTDKSFSQQHNQISHHHRGLILLLWHRHEYSLLSLHFYFLEINMFLFCKGQRPISLIWISNQWSICSMNWKFIDLFEIYAFYRKRCCVIPVS